MIKVDQFVHFLFDFNPQNTPVRLAMYNFFKFNLFQESDLEPWMFEEFFCQCLEYPHWMGNKAQLGREVKFLIQNLNERNKRHPIQLDNIRFPSDIQVIEIENFKDLHEVCSEYIESLLETMDRYRIVMDSQKRPLGLIVRENQSCEIHQFDKKFTLRNGRLEPLRARLKLFYSSDLALDPSKIQNIEISPYLTTQFKISESRKVHGFNRRGYIFQNLSDYQGLYFFECSKLFLTVKTLESLFFEKNCDEDYKTLVTSLESKLHQSQLAFGFQRSREDQDLKKLEELLLSAEQALAHVFAGDKYLSNLIQKCKSQLERPSDFSL